MTAANDLEEEVVLVVWLDRHATKVAEIPVFKTAAGVVLLAI